MIAEKHQRVIFARLGLFAIEIAIGSKHRQDADRQYQDSGRMCAKPSTTSRFENAEPGTE